MDALAIAFAMRCDDEGLSLEDGIEAADRLSIELFQVAEDRLIPETENA